jgi:hypothetical protein
MANKKTRVQLPSNLNYNEPKGLSETTKGVLSFGPFFFAVSGLATHMYLDRPSHEIGALVLVTIVTFMFGVAMVSP